MPNIQVIKENSLGINRGLYVSWMGNTLSDANSNQLIAEGAAVLANLPNPKSGQLQITSSRNSATSDDGAVIYNASSSNYILTIAQNTITQATQLQQEDTGTITLVAGSGVTFVGSSLATTGPGSLLTILPTSTPNTYNVVKDGSTISLSEQQREAGATGVVGESISNAFVMLSGDYSAHSGFIPKTHDYAGILEAIKSAHRSTLSRNVVFEDVVYDLGDKYIPIVGGVNYVGVTPKMTYTNGDWGDRNLRPLGGSRFTTTHDYVFWDGALDQVSITPNVSNQTCTVVAGSINIAVPNSSLFPIGSRVYTPESFGGFVNGTSYFVLTSSANIITIGLADKVALPSLASGTLTLSMGKPNDGTSHTKMTNLIGLACKTMIKCGAKNTFGFLYSELNGIWAFGGATKRVLVDHTNYSQSTFERIFTYDGDGQYHGCDYPLGIFIPGNSVFRHVFNANNGTGSSSLYQRGIRFQCENGSNLNEVHAYTVQNNNSLVTTQTQTATTTNASSDISVADGTKYPLDMPVWFSAIGSNTNITLNIIYFVVYNSGNTIRVSASKGSTAITHNWTGSTTINAKGYPGLEVVAVGNGYITSSNFDALDIEADATTHIVAQQATADFGIVQCSANQTQWGFTARTVNGMVRNNFEVTTTDIDKNCRLMWLGSRTGNTAASNSYGGYGMWYDKQADMVAVSMHHDSSISVGIPVDKPLLWGMKPSPFIWAKANFPIGLIQYTQDTTRSFTGSSPVGHIVFNGAAGQTFTLPTIVDAATKTSMVGYEFWVTNASGNALSVATNGTQTLNNISAKTSFNLAANTACRFVASKTSGGTLFWSVLLSAVLP